MPFHAFVFSYNRGEFLQNCVESIRSQAPQFRITVVDDNSTDPATEDYLKALPAGVSLLRPEAGHRNRHGGLYANMQRALERSSNTDILLFIQDDMQLVRPLGPGDGDYIRDFFKHYPGAAFLNPVFLKGMRARRNRRITRIAADFPVYFREYPRKKSQTGLSYADVVLAHAGSLQAAGWHFEQEETKNAQQAAQLFGKMGLMAHPFVMFLPQAPMYRGKRKSLAVRLSEHWSGATPKSFYPMTTAEVDALKRRDLSCLPVAEQFLRCTDSAVKKPYCYSAVNAYPLLRAMHKVEQGLGRLFAGGR